MKKSIFVISMVAGASVLFSSACTPRKETGNVLRVAIREKYKSLDPAQGSEYYSNVLIQRAYEGLYGYHYLKRPYELEPVLAAAMPSVSRDGLTYRITIRKGVLFQDDKAFAASKGKGREVTAEDFVYSFKRIGDPANLSSGWWIFDGKVVGFDEWRKRAVDTGAADYDAKIAGLRAVDASTLEVKLKHKDALFLHMLTLPYADVVAREVVEFYGKEFSSHPVGTGPFRLTKLLSNQLVWVKSPTYRKCLYPNTGSPGDRQAGLLSDAAQPIPFVDKVVDDIIPEDTPAWLNFMQGNHDYLMRIPKDNSTAIFDAAGKPTHEMRDRGITVIASPAMEFTYVAFNMDDAVVGGPKNKFLRKAMALAYDEAPIIERFYLGLASSAQSPVVPGVPGFDARYRNPSREYNLTKARELLAKAGHPGGKGIPELVYDTTSGTSRRQLAEYFQRAMGELGIKVQLNLVSWPELISRVRKKQAQIWDISWIYDYPDAENAWQLLASKNESPGPNASNFKNREFDRLYQRLSMVSDVRERAKVFAKMNAIMAEEVPWILGVYKLDTRLVHPWVGNFKIHSFDYNVEKYLRVDAAKRAQTLR